MEANRVMSDEQIEQASRQIHHGSHPLGLSIQYQQFRAIAKAQAEISFKAGRESMLKEVVEWIEAEFTELILGGEKLLEFKVMDEEWQAKLKEWNVKTE